MIDHGRRTRGGPMRWTLVFRDAPLAFRHRDLIARFDARAAGQLLLRRESACKKPGGDFCVYRTVGVLAAIWCVSSASMMPSRGTYFGSAKRRYSHRERHPVLFLLSVAVQYNDRCCSRMIVYSYASCDWLAIKKYWSLRPRISGYVCTRFWMPNGWSVPSICCSTCGCTKGVESSGHGVMVAPRGCTIAVAWWFARK